MIYPIVHINTPDDLFLYGMLLEAEEPTKTAFLFVHGTGSSFFCEDFIESVSKELLKTGVTVLLGNNRGASTMESWQNSGAAMEKFEDCLIDIDGWIEYLQHKGYNKIILCGHSLGSEKVVYYMSHGKHVDSVVSVMLLGFADSFGTQEKFLKSLNVDPMIEAKELVEAKKGYQFITLPWLCHSGELPKSAESYINCFSQGSELSKAFPLRQGKDLENYKSIKVPIFAAISDGEEYTVIPVPEAIELLKRENSNSEVHLLEGTKHCFEGQEGVIASMISDFIVRKKIKLMRWSIKRIVAFSILMVAISFIINFALSVTYKRLIPTMDWPSSTAAYFPSEKQPMTVIYLWNIFDTGFYVNIAKSGYDSPVLATNYKNWAFYPLFPLTIKYVSAVFRLHSYDSFFYAGMFLSNLFLIGSLVVLYKLFQILHLNEHDWAMMCLLLLTFPSSYFYHMAYPESLFMLLSMLVFYYLAKQKYFPATVFAILLSITKVQGILIIPAVSVSYLISSKKDLLFKRIVKSFGIGLLGVSGIFAFFYYLQFRTGNFLSAFTAQQGWKGMEAHYPYQALYRYIESVFTYKTLFLPEVYLSSLMGLLFVGLCIYLVNVKELDPHLRTSLALFGLAFIGVSTSYSLPTSLFRFLSVCFPAFVSLLYICKSKKHIFPITLICFSLIHAILLLFFVNKYPFYGY